MVGPGDAELAATRRMPGVAAEEMGRASCEARLCTGVLTVTGRTPGFWGLDTTTPPDVFTWVEKYTGVNDESTLPQLSLPSISDNMLTEMVSMNNDMLSPQYYTVSLTGQEFMLSINRMSCHHKAHEKDCNSIYKQEYHTTCLMSSPEENTPSINDQNRLLP